MAQAQRLKEELESCTFSPSINEKSKSMAVKHRKKTQSKVRPTMRYAVVAVFLCPASVRCAAGVSAVSMGIEVRGRRRGGVVVGGEKGCGGAAGAPLLSLRVSAALPFFFCVLLPWRRLCLSRTDAYTSTHISFEGAATCTHCLYLRVRLGRTLRCSAGGGQAVQPLTIAAPHAESRGTHKIGDHAPCHVSGRERHARQCVYTHHSRRMMCRFTSHHTCFFCDRHAGGDAAQKSLARDVVVR